MVYIPFFLYYIWYIFHFWQHPYCSDTTMQTPAHHKMHVLSYSLHIFHFLVYHKCPTVDISQIFHSCHITNVPLLVYIPFLVYIKFNGNYITIFLWINSGIYSLLSYHKCPTLVISQMSNCCHISILTSNMF